MKTTLLSLGIIAIAAISVSSCESGKARVAKMEQISINGKDFRLEIEENGRWVRFHPEGSNGEEGCRFDHEGGPGSPIYATNDINSWYATHIMLQPESEDGEEKSVVFNLDLKKIIFTTELVTYFQVLPTEELLVPGGKMHGVIITRYRATLGRYRGRVYTLDGVLRYDNKKKFNDLVIEGGYIYDAAHNGHKPSQKLYKILPDGSKERL
jgi:hypothetical protein